ncbi:DUF4097 family beta strand repeat-containing protein [Aeromicrobium sp. CTD01-1L150]|uniref:DUF4097 family beta strand repeat-containing protein n=1 Tax=Aeromicrobium sp. CTD01-1L150 TaxID=3341830 RepID=UPI0035BF2460
MNHDPANPSATSAAPGAGRHRRGWKLIGITVTALVIVGGLVMAPVLVWAFAQQVGTTTERDRDTFERATDRVTIEGETAAIDVQGTAEDRVTVDRSIEWARTRPEVVESWQGTDLDVDLDCSGVGLLGWVNDVCRIDYRAEVPATAALALTTTTGDIGIDAVAGDVELAATTGSIGGTALEADWVSTQATTGSIDLGFSTAPRQIAAEVTTGHIVVTVPDDGTRYHVTGETGTGQREIQIATDPRSDRVINVSTTTGDVTVRYTG